MAVLGGHCGRVFILAFLIAVITSSTLAESNVGQLSVSEIEDALQVRCLRRLSYGAINAESYQQCPLVQELNIHKRNTTPEVPGYASQVFETLFPGISVAGLSGPAVNALLATLYISGPPSQ